MGHVGLQPQSVNQLGGYRKRGTLPQEADAILADAEALQQAGAFAIVLESVPSAVARARHGARRRADDRHWRGAALRRSGARQPRHARDVGRVRAFVRQAVRQACRDRSSTATGAYVDDVRAGRFPEVHVRAEATPIA